MKSSITLDTYSHVALGLQEADVTRFDDVSTNRYNSDAENERRGVRVVHGAALEKRSRCFSERGFESRPLRHSPNDLTLFP
jgi:hypothetical protein